MVSDLLLSEVRGVASFLSYGKIRLVQHLLLEVVVEKRREEKRREEKRREEKAKIN
jgi:hypothetical protein